MIIDEEQQLPLVSVVVTTKNEEKNIGNCLESVKKQTYPRRRIETIVVDNESSDKTKAIAQRYTEKVFEKGPERSAQRNYGIMEKSSGRYVIYLDADMILSPTVIKRSIRKLEDSHLVGLYISEVVLGKSFWSQVRRFERSFYDGTVVDCVRIIRKDAFDKVGGFDLTMTGPEDWDFDRKIRNIGRVGILDSYNFEELNERIKKLNYSSADFLEILKKLTAKAVIYHNEAEFDLNRYLAKKTYYSKSFATYIKKWGKDNKEIKKQFGLWYRYIGVFLENGKWIRLFRHSILSMGMYFLRVAVGVNYLRFKN